MDETSKKDSVQASSESFSDVVEQTLKKRTLSSNAAKPPISQSKDQKESADVQGDALRAAISGAGYLFFLQCFSKVLTFTVNQILLRHVTPSVFGIATIQMELLVSTILFFSREPLRLATLRVSELEEEIIQVSNPPSKTAHVVSQQVKKNQLQRVVNVSWLAPLAAAPLALLLAWYYINYLPEPEMPSYAVCVWMYAFGSWLDTVAEPFYAVSYYLLYVRLRTVAEGIALIISCSSACYFSVYVSTSYGLAAFAIARVLFGLSYLTTFAMYFAYQHLMRPDLLSFGLVKLQPYTTTIKEKQTSKYFDRNMLQVAWSFLKQSLLKHLLTEGDKFFLSVYFSSYDKGVYALVFNYGSIVARVVFLPLEDMARLVFSRFSKGQPEKAKRILQILLKALFIFGLVLMAIGSNYTLAFLKLLVGPQWTQSPVGTASMSPAVLALTIYCASLFMMGINGITEAFVSCVATPGDLQAQSYWLMVCSVVFAATGYMCFEWGAAGLVLANTVNFFCRILWSSRFIANFFSAAEAGEGNVPGTPAGRRFGGSSWLRVLPSKQLVNVLALSWLVTRWSNARFVVHANASTLDVFVHIAVGIGCGLLNLLTMAMYDLPFLHELVQLYKGKVA